MLFVFFIETKVNFEKQKSINSLGSNYDWKSIMHYGRKAFSKNDQPTIVLKSNPDEELGGLNLTDSDVYQIKKLYECPDNAVTTAVTSNAKETAQTSITTTTVAAAATATPQTTSTILSTTTATTKPTVTTTNVPTTTTISKTSKPTTTTTTTKTTPTTTKPTSTTLKPTTTKTTTTASTTATKNTRKTTTTTDSDTSPNSKGNSCDKYSDIAPNCSSLEYLCQNKNYIVPLYCPKTCCLIIGSP